VHSGPNLSTSLSLRSPSIYCSCRASTIQIHYSGHPLSRVTTIICRHLAHQVGALGKESPARSMAPITYNFIDTVLEEGTSFLFGSWLCVADGAGGFTSYLAYSARTSSLPLASSSEASGDLADKLGNLMIADPISSRADNVESEQVSGPSETHLPGVDFGLCDSARIIPAEHHTDSTKNHPDWKVVSDDRASAHPEAQSKTNPSTSTTQGHLGKAEKVPGLPEGPGLFFVTTSEGEVVYCLSSEYYSGSRLVNVIIDGLPYQNRRPIYAPTVLQSF
jgi:hypothetical protein